MNVKDLKLILDYYPDDTEIWVLCEGYGNPMKAEQEDIKLSSELIGPYFSNEKKIVFCLGRNRYEI